MKKGKTLSSPNTMVFMYFEALRRLCSRVDTHENDRHKKQDTALCIVLAVTGVEVFLNMFFRVLVEEEGYTDKKEQILSDLKRQISLDRKIAQWPLKVFGKGIDLGSGIGQRFQLLKKKRNAVVHFSSTYESIELPGITINGLADTTIYESLGSHDAVEALMVAEQFVGEIFRLRGVEDANICHALHSWTGKIPAPSEYTQRENHDT